MSSKQHKLIILFADIAGSTNLYEQLGDVIAHECIVESLETVSQKVKQHEGVVVEIIGDEIMAYFHDPRVMPQNALV